MNRKLRLVLVGILAVGTLMAQESNARRQKNQKLEQQLRSDRLIERVDINESLGTPSSLSFSANLLSNDGLTLFKESIGKYKPELLRNMDYKTQKSIPFHGDMEVTTYAQYYKGIKLEHGGFGVTTKGGKAVYMSSELYDFNGQDLDISPKLTENQALIAAMNAVGARTYMWDAIQYQINATDNPEKKAVLNAEMQNYMPKGELVIIKDFEIEDNPPMHLAFKFDIYALDPLCRDYVFIDAHNGKVIYREQIIKHLDRVKEMTQNGKFPEFAPKLTEPLIPVAKPNILEKAALGTVGMGLTRYAAFQSFPDSAVVDLDEDPLGTKPNVLQGTHRNVKLVTKSMDGNGVPNLNNPAQAYSAATNIRNGDHNYNDVDKGNADELLNDDIALDAHWGTTMVVNYWKDRHNRNSYNNGQNNVAANGTRTAGFANTDLISYVHFSAQYDNAFWNGSFMTYGDGMSFRPLTSLDVCGHEVGHGVCTNVVNLAYNKESGAMNEGFSDIWGACIENYALTTPSFGLPATNFKPWGIGEQIDKSNTNFTNFTTDNYSGLRRMDFPKLKGNPDTYDGTNWTAQLNCSPTLANDQCGVHNNSGVLNKWFYLLTTGVTNYTNDKGINPNINVDGLGFDVAEKIAFGTEVGLAGNTGATFMQARVVSLNYTAANYGGTCSNEYRAVTNAWAAVNVGSPYVPCGRLIDFVNGEAVVPELVGAKTCPNGSRVVNIPLTTPTAPTSPATITFTVKPTSTATRGKDFDMPNTISISAAGVTNLPLTIYDDENVETDETIELSFTVSGGGSAAGFNDTRIIIDDNDVVPQPGVTVLLNEGFETTTNKALPTGWALNTIGGSPDNRWMVGRTSAATASGGDATGLGTDKCLVVNSPIFAGTANDTADAYNSNVATDIIASKKIDARGITGQTLTFNWVAGGGAATGGPSDYGAVVYSLDGVNWTEIDPTHYAGTGQSGVVVTLFVTSSRTASALKTITIPSFLDNVQYHLGFRFVSNTIYGGPSGFNVDDVMITGVPKQVQTAKNLSGTGQLGANDETYFYSDTDGKLIAKIKELSGVNHGCVTVSVDRDLATAGGNTKRFLSSDPTRFLSAKGFTVNSTLNQDMGSYEITLYLTGAEKTAYETTASTTFNNNLFIHKVSNAAHTAKVDDVNGALPSGYDYRTSTTTTTGTIGNAFFIKGIFTNGFSSFGIGADQAIVLGADLLAFNAQKVGNFSELTWATANEKDLSGYEIERSTNSEFGFTNIGFQKAVNQESAKYSFLDKNVSSGNTYYYRLKTKDLNGKEQLSSIVSLVFNAKGLTATLAPNPTNGLVNIQLTGENLAKMNTTYKVFNAQGQQMMFNTVSGNMLSVDLSAMPKGAYWIRLENGNDAIVKKVTLQ